MLHGLAGASSPTYVGSLASLSLFVCETSSGIAFSPARQGWAIAHWRAGNCPGLRNMQNRLTDMADLAGPAGCARSSVPARRCHWADLATRGKESIKSTDVAKRPSLLLLRYWLPPLPRSIRGRIRVKWPCARSVPCVPFPR